MSKSRTYKGHTIYECESLDRSACSHNGKWIVQTYHTSRGAFGEHQSTPYADELCPHFTTLGGEYGAYAYINERIEEAARYA